jgi:serine/threonine protein kinase/Tol biopolymer transport system component
MGEVFRARDPRLQRDVALKILAGTAVSDPDRQQRFLREARAASALNHPNILAVYDVGTERGSTFIVSELIDGASLRQYVNRAPLPIKELLDVAVQMADGLAAAHGAGIVHRDLKPENIMITRDGRLKILDFGLAKVSQSDAAIDGLETRTDAGLILGTVPYMSPEQARGAGVDFRTDQFSVGLILYELATGQRAFRRDSGVQTLSAIIEDTPRAVTDFNPRIPVPLLWVIDRCLAKDPRDRYAATSDLAHDLRTIRERLAEVSSGAITAQPQWGRRVGFVAAASSIALAVGALALLFFAARQPSGADLSAYRFTPLATDSGYQGSPAWSPDGKTFAYVAEVDGITQVFTRSLGSSQRAPITRSRFHCHDPFWSPDGSRIFFGSLARDKEGIWSVSAAGGEQELVLEDATNAAISPDGKTIAFLREEYYENSYYRRLWLLSPLDAEPKRYLQPPFDKKGYADGVLHFSPDGSKLGAWISPLALEGGYTGPVFWIIPMAGGRPYAAPDTVANLTRALVPFSWLPDNRHMIAALGQPRTPGTHLWLLDTQGEPARPVTLTSASENSPAVSPDGGRLAFAAEAADFDLVQIDLNGSAPRTLLATSRNEMDPTWSPDGSQYAFVTDRNGNQQIWLRSREGQWERPLITENDFVNSRTYLLDAPTFSADGQRIAYERMGPENFRIWISTVAGGPPVRLTADDGLAQFSPSWSPDGTWVAYAQWKLGRSSLAKARVGEGRAVSIKEDILPFTHPRWSPNGEWIACETSEGLILMSPDGKRARALSEESWLAYGWAPDSSQVYGIRASNDLRELMLATVDVGTGREQVVAANLGPVPLESHPVRGFSVISAKSVATSIVRVKSDVWLLDGFTPRTGFFERFWPFHPPNPADREGRPGPPR